MATLHLQTVADMPLGPQQDPVTLNTFWGRLWNLASVYSNITDIDIKTAGMSQIRTEVAEEVIQKSLAAMAESTATSLQHFFQENQVSDKGDAQLEYDHYDDSLPEDGYVLDESVSESF